MELLEAVDLSSSVSHGEAMAGCAVPEGRIRHETGMSGSGRGGCCTSRKAVGLAVSVLALLLSSCLPSIVVPGLEVKPGQWNAFRGGPSCQAAHDDAPTPPLRLMWKHGAKGAIVSSPVIADSTILLASLGEDVVALGLADGAKQGALRAQGAGAASPALLGHTLFIASEGKRYTLVAVNLRRGKRQWRRELGDVSASPTGTQGVLLAGSHSGTVFALDADSGDTLWSFDTGDQIHGSVAVFDTVVYAPSTDHVLYAFSLSAGRRVWAVDLGAAVYTTPALSETAAFLGTADGTFYCLNRLDGTIRWRFKAEGPVYSSAALADQRVFFGCDDGAVYALWVETGDLLWKFQTDGPVPASPVVTRNAVYVGSGDGVFYALEAATGAELWRFETDGPIEASAALSELGVYVGSTDRCLYAFGPQ